MLTPEYLNLIEFNDVVNLYNKLNIDITADIITRISTMGDITAVSRKQMKILLQTNGAEVFNNALEKTSLLTRETKNALKLLFENMAKEDMQGYKELYEYRDKMFQLSETQYKILNQGLQQTNRLLKNMTNTIAFQSQQAYVNAVDEAYMKTVTGAFDYNKAINTAVQRLADHGITLKDKLGRNVQLEVAVRRNVLSGIHETANNINRSIENDLGCNGYEVTAHLGARPTHAEAQGKQYAISNEDAKKYGVELWSDISDLWNEYNCRHTYFGIILGISEPIYNSKELKEFKNATVTLNGKQVPYYEATQIQRSYENNIRKIKRSIQTLDKVGIDSSKQRSKLRQWQMKQTAFCKETGLKKDYSRMKIAINKVTKEELDSINKYVSSDFYTINEKLRNGQELSTKEINLVRNLDNALDRLPKYTGLVRRSVELGKTELTEFLKVHQIGLTVTYPAYTSVTAGERYNNNSQVELYIYSQNGKNMIKYNNNEKEVLYKRNSSFIVKEIEFKNNVYHILLEEKNE